MKRKLLIIAFTTVIIAATLSGCSNKPATSQLPSSTAETTAAAASQSDTTVAEDSTAYITEADTTVSTESTEGTSDGTTSVTESSEEVQSDIYPETQPEEPEINFIDLV